MTRTGRIASVVVAIVLAIAGSAALSAAASKPVRGKGRLLAPMLVYAYTPKNDEDGTLYYSVFFRTAAGFPGAGHPPGSMQVDDAISRESEVVRPLGAGKPKGRCYQWTVLTTRKLSPKLAKKRAGDTVTVRFDAYKTALQIRKVKMRTWPPAAGRHRTLKKAIAKIGCRY